jgi:hypothetical protein
MGTVYPAYQHPPETRQHPPGDEMHVFDSYAPVRDMNLMAQGASGMNPYGMLPDTHWGQWWSAGDAAFADSANSTAPNVFGQEQHRFNPNYTLDQDTATQLDSPSTSVYSYPLPSPSTEATSLDISPGHDQSRRGSSSTQPDQRKRKRSTAPLTAAKPKSQSSATNPTRRASTRRASTRKTSKAEPTATAASEKPKRSSRSKAATKPPPPPPQSKKEEEDEDDDDEYGDEDAEADPEEEFDAHSKKVQERNRIASNKFRIKKREDAIKLRADEEDMERANRKLNNCVSELTLQVYDLKMKLLQHTDCDCSLIQDYIATEAQRYIKDLGDGKHPNSTPALPPPPQHQHMCYQ